MVPPTTLFDEWLAAKKLGRRFDPIPPEVADVFRYQQRVFADRVADMRALFVPGRNIDIYADFIDDGTCNGAADIYKSMGLVGLTKGLLLLPLDLFWRMFSHPAFLPQMGDARQERRGPQHDDGLLADYDDLTANRIGQGRSPHPTHPIHPSRQKLAQVCMELIWRFLAVHETVHIVHGHVDYLLSRYAIPFILEAQPFTIPAASDRDLDFQTIELWADSMAARGVLHGFFNSSPKADLQIGLEKHHKLFLWSMVMHALFRVWGFQIDLATMHTKTHPPSALRFSFLFSGVSYDMAEAEMNVSQEEYVNIVTSGMKAADMGIAYCGGKQTHQADLTPLLDPAVMAHRDRLAAHFDDVMYPVLEKYAYVALHRSSDPQPESST